MTIYFVFINHSKKIVSKTRLKLEIDSAASAGSHGKECISCTSLGLRLRLDCAYQRSVTYLHVPGSFVDISPLLTATRNYPASTLTRRLLKLS
jgi:hypothetical protein